MQIKYYNSSVDKKNLIIFIFSYFSGQAQLQTSTVQNLLSAANLFQLRQLRDGCANYMAKKLDVENCIGIHFFAQVNILYHKHVKSNLKETDKCPACLSSQLLQR